MSFIPAGDIAVSPDSPVPELRAVFAHFPDGLGAFDQMYERMVGRGRLDQAMRFTILGASARWRSDGYIAGAMFREALAAGLEPERLGSLIAEAEAGEADSPDGALLAHCRKVTHTAFKVVQADIDALLAHGWTNGQIVEATTMVSLSGYMTVMSASGGLLRAEELEPEPWR